ncbi:MAG: 23S rRNA (adenine(2503)-C(2))-methyltransferase RlmN [Prevotellaceae bacterium]|jgi:23S rRNA (adenine2503-C2)-methyltransferase|nr:23S rRNA (adenine(2503)-C(2))-methyltransferase RlmN [Prevotellaceae bacterium]
MKKEILIGKTLTELTVIAGEYGLPAFAAKQMADWLYKKQIGSIDEMSNLPKAKREQLAERYEVGAAKPVQEIVSVDGTKKYLFSIAGNQTIESVYIPEKDRATLCVSSQVGCKLNCLFCMTGKQGFQGNLTAGDIINQVRSIPNSDKLTNLVLMGMGEPFDNTAEVLKALEIMTSDYGYAWSPHRITVSTVGLIPGLQVFLDKSQCHLAVSLHSPFEKERLELMPVEKVYPLQKVLDLLRKYDFRHQRRLSFEYIMFEGFNDTMRHARELLRLLDGFECRVNLISFHAIPNVNLKSSNPDKMLSFRDYLSNNGIICTIRRSRGEDILAACGMLSSSLHN